MKKSILLNAFAAFILSLLMMSSALAQDIEVNDGATVIITNAGTYSNNFISTTANFNSSAILQINQNLAVTFTGNLSGYYGSVNLINGATLTLSPSSQFLASGRFYVGVSDATSAQTLAITSLTTLNTGSSSSPSITMDKYGILDLSGLTSDLTLTNGDLVLNSVADANAPKIKVDNTYKIIIEGVDKTITGNIDVSKNFDFSAVTDGSFTNNAFVFAKTKANASITGTPVTTGLSTNYFYSVAVAQNGIYYEWKLVRTPIVATVLASGGTTSANYTSLKAAFDAINSQTHTGAIQVQIRNSSTETAACSLNTNASYSSVRVYPIVTGCTISGEIAGNGLIELNGSDDVTIDGRLHTYNVDNENWTPSGNADLTISNISTSNTEKTSAILLINGACTNTVQYTNIKGSSLYSNAGIINFYTSSALTGNDHNLIQFNNITNAGGNRPINAIASLGTLGKENTANTIRYNYIYDFTNYNFINGNLNSSAIKIDDNNTAWNIISNSIYETNSIIPAIDKNLYAIFINSPNGNNFTVSNNYIGGSAPECGGTAWTKTNAYECNFYAIRLNVGSSDIQGNTIKNFNWSNPATNSLNSTWNGIRVDAGAANIGTSTGNTIGSATGTGSITMTNSNANGAFYGIFLSGSGAIDCQKNTIAGITCATSDNQLPVQFRGIHNIKSSGATTISNNNIGSAVANSVNLTSVSTGSAQTAYGIYSGQSTAVTISGNTIKNLNNATTKSGVQNSLVGIYTTAGTNTISNNNISKLSSAAGSSSAVVGINQSSNSAGVQTVSGNTISELNANGSSESTLCATAIKFNSDAANTSIIEKNFIHTLAATKGGYLSGITLTGGKSLVKNNIIALGNTTENYIQGIEAILAGITPTIVNNTVNIEQTAETNTAYTETYALILYNSNNTHIVKNNIFSNTRSGGGTNTNHIVAFLPQNFTTTTLDYNNYYSSSNRLTNTGTNSIEAFRTLTGQDAHSSAIAPSFTSAPSTTATNYKANTVLMGETTTDVTDDYAGVTRNVNTMGALIGPSFYITSVVQTPKNTWYVSGNEIIFKATLNEKPTLTGTPTLPFKIGTADKSASYYASSSSLSSEPYYLTFKYIVQSSENGDITIPSGSLVLSIGGSIKNDATEDLSLTMNRIDAGGTVDNTAPTISSVVTSPNSTWYKVGETINFAVTASEAVTVSGGIPSIGFTIGGTGKSATYFNSTSNNTVINFRYTVVANDNAAIAVPAGSIYLNDATIKDEAGNDATLTLAGINVSGTVDTQVPTITSITAPADSVYRRNQTFNIVVNTSEKVDVVNSPTVTFKIGTENRTASFVESNPAGTAHTFDYIVTANDDGMIDLASVAIDLATNSATMKDQAGNDANISYTYSGNDTKKYAKGTETIFYVKTEGGDDSNTGLTWTTAKSTPTRAINTAISGDQVWVAKGTYKPTSAYDIANPTNRHKHFRMKNGVAIYGGFVGTEASDYNLSLRNFATNATILSGDLNGNDQVTGSTANTLAFANYGDNCYNVVYIQGGLNNSSILDGFIVKGGNANDDNRELENGGGISCFSSVTLKNLTIKNNYAVRGGGIYCDNSNPIINNVRITENKASYGGGIEYYGATSINNSQNILVDKNYAFNGAGVYLAASGAYVSLKNFTIANNASLLSGSGIYSYSNTTLNLLNSIVWGNSGNQIEGRVAFGGAITNSCYSANITGDFQITNSITTDPAFVNAALGDFRIFGTSPCVDAGNNNNNDLTTDIRGTGFGRKLAKADGTAGTIDMGVYEYKFGSDPAAPSPELTTKSITDITINSAKSGGDITTDNGKTITAKGIVWSLTTEPKLTTNELGKTSETVASGNETASFNSDITSLANNTKYYVRAYAINELGTGYGDEEVFTTLSNAPTANDVSLVDSNKFTVNWTAPVNTGSETITYSLEVSTSIEFTSTAFTQSAISSANTSVIATGLTANTHYYARVKAVNAGGSSAWSNTKEQTTLCGKPTIANASVVDSTSVTANWSAPTQGREAFTYVLQIATTNQFAQNDIVFGKDDIASTENHYDVTEIAPQTTLDPNTTYYYRVACKNAAGTGAYSTVKNFITKPSAPIALNASNQSGTQFTANWQAPSRVGSLTPFTYTIQMSTEETFATQNLIEETSALASTVLFKDKSGFTAGTIYYYRVKIVSGAKESGWSNVIQAATYPELDPTYEVSDIRAKNAKSGGKITFNGGVEVTESGLVVGTSEDPEVNSNNKVFYTNPVDIDEFTNLAITGLTPGTTYYVRTFAKNVVGYGYGTQVSFTTATRPRNQATNLAFTNITKTTMTVSWTRGNGDSVLVLARGTYAIPANPVTDGVIYPANSNYSQGNLVSNSKVVYNGTGTSVSLTGLPKYTVMYFKAIEFNISEDPLYQQADANGNPRSRWTLRRDGMMEEDLTIVAEYPYPNPVSNTISTTLDMFEAGTVSAKLYDAAGRVAAELYNQSLPFGTHDLKFDISTVPSGVYQLIISKGSEAIIYPLSVVR